ncbi:hypothetical protein Gohar_028408 [Gossypium harknessii]|uniref:C2 domain-containing protein n=1 Tax=Gossypium harknessii TaxID=34285 RepID=A0A7J9IDM7_9ROSI|nr:hypothetical protein [Gossypium harknessii]
MEKDHHHHHYVLEITLISAQGLKEPSGQLRRMQTYALAWIDPSLKLRTCIDRSGGGNPTWNDKFLFKVSSDFLSKETSGVSVEIYSVGVLRDSLLGTVRLLVGNSIRSGFTIHPPSFTAVQVRRPSGRFHGVINIGVTVLDMADVPSMSGLSAVGFRDLIGESINSKKNRGLKKSKSTTLPLPGENLSDDQSDDCHSSTTSSSSPASTALREWNGIIREIEKRKNHIRSSSSEDGSLLCGLGLSSVKVGCLSPFIVGAASFNEGKNPP